MWTINFLFEIKGNIIGWSTFSLLWDNHVNITAGYVMAIMLTCGSQILSQTCNNKYTLFSAKPQWDKELSKIWLSE